MKVLVLSGNPRKNGNTMRITNRFIDGVVKAGGEVEFIDTTSLNVKPCTGCLFCEKKGSCSIKDEMNYVYEKIVESDVVVLSSPVYFASVSAQLKTVIDRCQMLFSRRYILKNAVDKKREGYIIFTAGGKNEKMIASMELLGSFFFLSCNGVLKESIFTLGTDTIPVEKQSEILNSAYLKGCKVVANFVANNL